MRTVLGLLLGLIVSTSIWAQPTYRLDVRGDLKPKADLKLNGKQIKRSGITDDPGFRVQFHFQKAGKTVKVFDARAETSVEVPSLENGSYSVTLELFYPAYKGGTAQKGEFKAISETLNYRIDAGKVMFVSSVPLKKDEKKKK